ncbi:MAG TPA: xanthine dehydrogenase accessory protein XdhC [Myxococcaceae bacterium]|nr:xanthine dehydrogenase accessory protein XdhC [Myxococcaceae bacterium]
MALYDDMAALVAEGRPFVSATVVSVSGSTPGKPGAKLLLLEDGSIRGTIGGGAIEQQVLEAARELLNASGGPETRLLETHLTHELAMCCGGKMTLFLERVGRTEELVLFGAGHVGKELASAAARVGFRVTVVDERAEWATPERFPEAAAIRVEDPLEVAKGLAGGPGVHVIITTHDHALDQSLVEALLERPSAYLGVIGSRRKSLRFRQRLEAAGFTAEAIEKLRSPIGLDIGAVTPAEIAVSVVAEFIRLRRVPAPTPDA